MTLGEYVKLPNNRKLEILRKVTKQANKQQLSLTTNKMKLSKEFTFLKKARFWSMVLVALSVWLYKDGYISEALSAFLTTLGGGFTVINTFDRTINKLTDK